MANKKSGIHVAALLKNTETSDAVRARLESAGFRVSAAKNLKEARKLAADEGFILADGEAFDACLKTEREKAELEKYFRVSLDLLCIADMKGNFLRLNPEWTRILGYSIDELLETNFLDLVHKDDLQATLGAVKDLKKNREVVGFVNRYRTKAGDYKWLSWRSFPSGNFIYAAAHDITMRIIAEQERGRITRLSEDALDAAKMAYWEFDVSTASFNFNERFYKLHGITDYDKPVMPGVDFRKHVVPEDSRKVEETMIRAAASELPFLESQIENRVIQSDGTMIWINTWFRVQRDASGQAVKIFGVNQDITERKKTEEKLDKALQEKQMLLVELQHRIKNSLAMIASLISLEEGRSEKSDTREVLSAIRGRVASIAVLYDMLHRSGGGGNVALDKYIEAIGDSVRSSLVNEEKRIRLDIECDAVELDVKRAATLGLIINELLTNSLKYAFAGRPEGRIRLTLKKKKEQYELSAADDGVGFPPAFDAAKSGGLGLQLVLALTEQLCGEFRISDLAGGAKIIILFPRPAGVSQ